MGFYALEYYHHLYYNTFFRISQVSDTKFLMERKKFVNNSQAILEILLQYIQKNGTTEKQCLIDCNINTSFLTDWKGGRLKNPSYDKIVKLAGYLNIDLNLLFLGEINSQKFELVDDERELLENYRQLSDDGKKEMSERAKQFAIQNTYKEQEIKPTFSNVEISKSNVYESRLLNAFRTLSYEEQIELTARAETMSEKSKTEENVG